MSQNKISIDEFARLKNAYKQRFGHTNVPPGFFNALLERQLVRTTVRIFQDFPIEDDLLELLIAGAQGSPTSGILQTYSVIALTKSEDKAKFFTTKELQALLGDSGSDPQNQHAIERAPLVLIWVADLSRLNTLVNEIVSEDNTVNPSILHQTQLAEYHLKSIIDTAIVAQSFTILAESIGLGVMYWGALRQLPMQFFEEEFNLPKLTFPLFGMAVGWPEKDIVRKVHPRFHTNIVLHREKYKPIEGIKSLGDYNERHFSHGNDAGTYTFKQRLINRLTIAHCKLWIADGLRYMGFTFK
jgi:hypothetical protein